MGPVRFTLTIVVLPGEDDVVIIAQNTLREKLGIDVPAQLKASVLKAQRRQEDAEMKLNDGAALHAAMAVTAFVPGGDAPGDVDDEVILTLLSRRPMIFEDSEVEMRDRVGVLETAVETLWTRTARRDVIRCCAISFLARTLTCYIGRCWATHLLARSLWRTGFIHVQRWCGQSPFLNVIACRGAQQSVAVTVAR